MAIILPQTVKIKWSSTHKKHYINKGYTFTKIGDEFEVNVLDLPKSSEIKVLCICDICGKKVLKSFRVANPDKKTRNKSQKLICFFFNYKCVVEKTRQVNMERYGKPYAMQNDKIKQRQKDTNKRKYGVENVFQDKKIRQKAEDTMIEKYNVKYAIQNEHLNQKRKNTNKEIYGYEYPPQNNKVKNKISESNIEYIKSEDYKLNKKERFKKMNQSLYNNSTGICSKQQKHVFDLLNNSNYKLNYPCVYYLLDIVDIQNKIDIEYDGGGYNLPVKFGYTTQKEFNNKDIRRNYFVKSQGYKIIRIISNNDKLPKDDILLSLINECTNYLKYTNYTWIYIDLNKQKIISHAFNKNF